MNPSTDRAQWRVARPQSKGLRYYLRGEDCQGKVLQSCQGDQHETKCRAAIGIDSEELKRLKASLEGHTARTSEKKGGAPSGWCYTYLATFYRVLATRMPNRRTGTVI